MFESYYKTHLSKRLLGGRSVNDDYERAMLVKFKQECGYQFTTKLEGMFNDMKLSKDAMEEFRRGGQVRDRSLGLVAGWKEGQQHRCWACGQSSRVVTVVIKKAVLETLSQPFYQTNPDQTKPNEQNRSLPSLTPFSSLPCNNHHQTIPKKQNRVGGVELEVNVLTMGYWPTQQAPPCTLPAEIQACCARFEGFYFEKHAGTWAVG